MATSHSGDCENHSSDGTVALHRLQRVGRASRLEAAPPGQERGDHPIEPQQPRDRRHSRTHRHAPTFESPRFTFRTISWKSVVAAPPLALRTTSQPAAGTACRATARSRRRTRFRVTALRGLCTTIRPTRVGPGRAWRYIVRSPQLSLRPSRITRRNAPRPLSECLRHTAPQWSSRQPGATLGPSVLDDRAPRARTHPGPKPVLTFAASIVGLEGAFGHRLAVSFTAYLRRGCGRRNFSSLLIGTSIAARHFRTSLRGRSKLPRAPGDHPLTRLACGCLG
jgi:hypothetical protein